MGHFVLRTANIADIAERHVRGTLLSATRATATAMRHTALRHEATRHAATRHHTHSTDTRYIMYKRCKQH